MNKLDTQKLKGDTSKFYSDDKYEDFIITFLRFLEPIQLYEGESILREFEKAQVVTFIMDGEIEVGYNHQDFVFSRAMQIRDKVRMEATPNLKDENLEKALMMKFEAINKK